jgi:hypothetical protein
MRFAALASLLLSSSAAGKVLFRANWSAPFHVVEESKLLAESDGILKRVRMPQDVDPAVDWVLESGTPDSNYMVPTGTASITSGGLNLSCAGSHVVLWRNQWFPPRCELRFGVSPLNTSNGLNIVFFGASADSKISSNGSIFALPLAPRQGNYTRYNNDPNINVYSDSYFRPDGKTGPGICDRTPEGLCAANLRRDPGFKMVKAGIDLIGGGPSKVYEVVVRRDRGMIQVLVDGKASVEWEDPQPYGGGYFGLRQMWQTNSSLYSHFEVVSLD